MQTQQTPHSSPPDRHQQEALIHAFKGTYKLYIVRLKKGKLKPSSGIDDRVDQVFSCILPKRYLTLDN